MMLCRLRITGNWSLIGRAPSLPDEGEQEGLTRCQLATQLRASETNGILHLPKSFSRRPSHIHACPKRGIGDGLLRCSFDSSSTGDVGDAHLWSTSSCSKGHLCELGRSRPNPNDSDTLNNFRFVILVGQASGLCEM